MLITNRLMLRTWQEEDLLPFAALNQDARVMQYFPECLNLEGTQKLLNLIAAHYRSYGYGLYAVTLKDTKEFIGYTGIYNPIFKAHFIPSVSIGWRLAAKHWGNGYATEAADAVLHEAFKRHGIKEIVAFCSANNLPSRRIMEKLGMIHSVAENFIHPDFAHAKGLSEYVLYRVSADDGC
jgi:RimJ/RimL family protein N-acetyltransferase